LDPDPTPDPTPSVATLRMQKKIYCFFQLTRRHIIFSLKNLIFC
jgi:hypothetical protein